MRRYLCRRRRRVMWLENHCSSLFRLPTDLPSARGDSSSTDRTLKSAISTRGRICSRTWCNLWKKSESRFLFFWDLFCSSVFGNWARHFISKYLFVRSSIRMSVCHPRDPRPNGSRCPILFKSHYRAMFLVCWSQNFATLNSGVRPERAR